MFNRSRYFKYGCRWCRTRSTNPVACNTAAGVAGLVLPVPVLQYGCPCCRTRSTDPAATNSAVGAAGLVLLLVPLPEIVLPVLQDPINWSSAIWLPVLKDSFY